MTSKPSRPNVLFVCVDAMRSDFALGEFGGTKPFFEHLERTGVAFDTMISAASSTTPCVASYLTGTYPPDHGVLSLRDFSLNEESTTLAELFQDAGYETRAHVCGPLTRDTGLDAGFDSYEHRGEHRTVYTDWYDELVSHLETLSEPWFVYLHLWEAHVPRDLPPDTEPSELAYDASLRGVADNLHRLLDVVDLTETVVAVTGDHGESIYDGTLRNKLAVVCLRQVPIPFTGMRTKHLRRQVSDRILRPRGFESDDFYNSLRRFSAVEFPNSLHRWGHGYHVYDFLVRVPFLLSGPTVPNRSRIERQVRQVDIFPTLLSVAGIERSVEVTGQDLLSPSYQHRPAYVRADSAFDSEEKWVDGVRYDGWKFVTGRGRPLRQLFDLETDPSERHNVVDTYPEKAAQLESLVDEEVAREKRADAHPSEAARERMTRRLQDLGYL